MGRSTQVSASRCKATPAKASILRPDGTERCQITILEEPTRTMDTQWGTLTYREWCEREADRMNQAGHDALVAYASNGSCCVCRP